MNTKRFVIGDETIIEVEMPKTPRTHRTKNLFQFGANSPKWTIGHRIDKPVRSLTENCDLPDKSVFPVLKHKIISDQCHGLFYEPTEGSGKIYGLQPLPFNKGIHIGIRYPERHEDLPGPADYSPIYDEPHKLTSLSRTRNPEIWEGSPGLSSPGPGSYNIGPQLRKPARWFLNRRVTAPPVDDIIR